ncbi:carboxylating nicotinate-nucleotide diphosphorylase [Terriglobus sp. TAA 43]|uniref:carboxylating nicotinate-nucleotide diphosphorylase n=1 Tax=Terriglobus sp. TAA 43 TaxID=278961 RepID=UPI000647D983|nr:carboxylating nicotinate-nucleotide diphosphorylase [Terriglobus sp. TAA 43]
MILAVDAVDRIVRIALDEDAPWGDVTSELLISEDTQVTAILAAREDGVLSGAQVFAAAMRLVDPATLVTFSVRDAESFTAGQVLATVSGFARNVLRGERVALNFIQRMSGIATLTAKYVSETAGTKARIVDTRKTTPGLRLLERYAVRCGGGSNHRYSLSDAVLAKDNHLAIVTDGGKKDLSTALREARSRLPHTTHFEVEVDRPDQIEPVLSAGVDTIMLDNFTTEQMRDAVKQINGRALVEASGGVQLPRIREIAETGVDIISVGALTHSVRALDLGLDIEDS